MLMVAAWWWSIGSAAGGLIHLLDGCTGPVVLDRVVDETYAVFLIGPHECEVVVPVAEGVETFVPRDDEDRTRIETKLEQLRARGSRLTPEANEPGLQSSVAASDPPSGASSAELSATGSARRNRLPRCLSAANLEATRCVASAVASSSTAANTSSPASKRTCSHVPSDTSSGSNDR